MNKYSKLASILLFTIRLSGMEIETPIKLDDVITFLGQQPITIKSPNPNEQYPRCHSIAELTNDDHVTLRIGENKLDTWDLATNQLLHSEDAPKNCAVPYDLDTVINDKFMAKVKDQKIVSVYELATDKLIIIFKEPEMIIAKIINDTKIITGLWNGDVRIREINTGVILHNLAIKGTVKALGLHNNKLIIGANAPLQIWNIDDGTLFKKFQYFTVDVQGVTLNDNHAAVITTHDLKVWDIHTDTLITTIKKQYQQEPMQSFVMNDDYLICAPYLNYVQAWRLSPDLNGTPESNPLLWIMRKATEPQQDLIKRAYKATCDNQKFLIALPENPGIVSLGESQEIKDGRLYPTLTLAVRNYLRTRLNITVY